MAKSLIILALTFIQFSQILGHGRLMTPPARNTMWRFGYPTPVDYNDNELYCGGYAVQWNQNNGRCGVCGDSYSDPVPRPHESGGLFSTGLIGRRFAPGQIIDVEVELTANHKGYFELRLCPTNDPNTPEKQDCFNKYPLYLEGQSTYRFHIPEDSKKQEIFNYRVKLPDGVTCTHCVIQWIYFTGNTWGICDNGTEAVGCGTQETFRNCADIAIYTNTGGFGPGGKVPPSPPNLNDNPYAIKVLTRNNETNTMTLEPLVIRSQVCIAHDQFKGLPNIDAWCMANCLKYPPSCPENVCHCITDCVPTPEMATKPGTDIFCHIHCLRYPVSDRCPSWCQCH